MREKMHTFAIYYENADTDEPKRLLGTIEAEYAGQALQKASEYWEVPSYDLVYIQLSENTVFPPHPSNLEE